jgi:hypothetical protein
MTKSNFTVGGSTNIVVDVKPEILVEHEIFGYPVTATYDLSKVPPEHHTTVIKCLNIKPLTVLGNI